MTSSATEESILGGCLVLDLTEQKGVLAARILGDLGAEVIKVEPPSGCSARTEPPYWKGAPHPEGSLFWFYTNLNKKSITLDIESQEGKSVFRRLVEKAQFVVESFEPGYLDSIGLGYEQLREMNASIVMTSITPFGQTGPYAHYRTTDIVCAALGGLMNLYGYRDRAPVRISQPQAWFQGSAHAATGSMIAHYHRELTGKGQHVDVSIQQAILRTLMHTVEQWDLNRVDPKRCGAGSEIRRPEGVLVTRMIYACQDGYVNFQWGGGGSKLGRESAKALLRIADEEGKLPELNDLDWDLLSFDSTQMDQERYDRICRLFEGFLLTKTRIELLELAAGADGQLLLAPIWTTEEVFESRQLEERDFWVEVEHPELEEKIVYPGMPVKMNPCPWRIYRPPPALGEHNMEIYGGELGLSRDEVTLLTARGVI